MTVSKSKGRNSARPVGTNVESWKFIPQNLLALGRGASPNSCAKRIAQVGRVGRQELITASCLVAKATSATLKTNPPFTPSEAPKADCVLVHCERSEDE